MKLPLYLAISAAVHAVLGAVVGEIEPPAPPPAARPPTIDIVEVVVAPPPPPAPTPAPVAAAVEAAKPVPVAKRPTRGAATTARVTTPGTAAVEVPGPSGPTPTERGPRSPYFDMRRGGRVDLSLPTSRDDLDRAPAGTAPAQGVAVTGQLDSAAGGRKKSNQDVFVAKVERDGSVRITDTQNLQVERSWNPAKLLSGRFDVTDYLMRKTGNDPYASRKLKFLDETRAERVELGKQWRKEQLQQTAMIMKRNLAAAWNASPDMAAKKRALFELWDEIVEPRTTADQADEVLVEASRTARNAVVGFIRAHLPAGTTHAYSTDELVALNAKKQSAATFAPYP